MMSILSFLCLALLLLPSCTAMYDDADSAVQTFENKTDFKNRVLEGDGVWIVQFYAPWCGHCKALEPKYKAVASILRGIVNVGAVDAATEGQAGKRIAAPFGVSGFPTIKIFGADKSKPIAYEDAREEQNMIQAALNEVVKTIESRAQGGAGGGGGFKPSGGGKDAEGKVVKLTASNFQEKVINNPLVSLVAFIAPWCGHCKALMPEWTSASLKLDDDSGAFLGIVDATVEESLAAQYQIQGFPTIKVFPGGIANKTPSDYTGPRTAEGIVRGALEEVDRTGVAKEIPELTGQKVLEENCSGQNSICVLVALPHILDSMAAGRNKYKDVISAVSKKFRGSAFHFLWFEGSSQPKLEEALGLTFGFPAVVALSLEKKAYAVQMGSFSDKSIGTFLSSITTGRKATIPIDSIPEVVDVEPWDGEDGVPFEEEPLDDIMGWDDGDEF